MGEPTPPSGEPAARPSDQARPAPPADDPDLGDDTIIRPSLAPQPPGPAPVPLPFTLANDPEPGSPEETLQRPGPARARGPERRPPEATVPVQGTVGPGAAVAPRVGARSVVGYEILAELGRGGMGVVYKARQLGLNRVVALKMVLAGAHAGREQLDRFRVEAEAVAGLQHPNIVQIYEVGESSGQPFFSMEFVGGAALDRRLAGAPQPSRAAAELVETLARAVHCAHQAGVVHRDLKPGNVLLAAPPSASGQGGADSAARLYGVPKISDFGLAKRLDSQSGHTRSGDLLGTPSYMSPEQAAGKVKEVGPAADIWALGAILYECLTGRPPFRAETPMDTLWQVINEEPIPPGRLRPGVPRDLETICLKCLQKDPQKRYPSAEQLAEDLRRHLGGEPVQARPPGRLERLARWCRRNPLPASLLVAVTLGAALGLWHLSQLSRTLVESAALESAAQQSETLDQLNVYYGQVVKNLPSSKVRGHGWERQKGAVPIPATLTIELGEELARKSATGVQVRLYSAYPFHGRQGGLRDDFGDEAWKRLTANPDAPVHRFEEMQGRPVLRYATARRLGEACVHCHNTHEDSPKTDWKVGDVRGVLEIIRPLDRDAERVEKGLRGTFVLVGVVAGGLLAVCGLVLLLSRRRRSPGSGGDSAAG
jgi:eukaryotic-like serine/threonine-protein kinase